MLYNSLIIIITAFKVKWNIYTLIIFFAFFATYGPSAYNMHTHNTYLISIGMS